MNKVEVIYDVNGRCTNKDEGWYTFQITVKCPKWAEKTMLFGIRYYMRKFIEVMNK